MWRQTQRQLNDLTFKIADTNDRLSERIEQMGDELRAADRRLGERIESLVDLSGQTLHASRYNKEMRGW